MTKKELTEAGLSEALADSIVAMETKLESLTASKGEQDTKISNLEGQVETLTTEKTALSTKVDTLESALETSETARQALESNAAQTAAEAKAKEYEPLTVGADACLAMAKLAKVDAEAANDLHDALIGARDELKAAQTALGNPSGEGPVDGGPSAGVTSELTDYVNGEMAKGLTRAEALATPEAKRLSALEKQKRIAAAAADND